MLLRHLFNQFYTSAGTPPVAIPGLPDVRVTSVTEDSRKALPGSVFVARSGTTTDGSRFLHDAAARGAVVAVAGRVITGSPLPVVVVPDPGAAASLLAHLLLGQPSRAMKVIGVTGTNGKTTTTYLIRQILARNSVRCGLIGTVEIDDGRQTAPAEMTTPDAVAVASLMARMRDNGCGACAIETSSHALHQGRVAGVRYAAAGFTNLTGDHLDYHGTMEAYAAAKARLFEMLPGAEDEAGTPTVAVVNADDPWSPRMVRDCRARVVRFLPRGRDGADYRALDVAVTASGTHFILAGPDGRAETATRLIGRHNVENALAAAVLCVEAFGLTVHQVAAGLRDAPGAPGRLQRVDAGQAFTVLVDYAHTDDALSNVLAALRPLCRGRLRVLFGCGGDRDRTKRPRMGAVAARGADVVYVTSDNPRTENPAAIIDEIVGGIPADTTAALHVEPDRRGAIEMALRDAQTGDIVLLAGKGHETYQIIGREKLPFDDAAEAARVLGTTVSAPCHAPASAARTHP